MLSSPPAQVRSALPALRLSVPSAPPPRLSRTPVLVPHQRSPGTLSPDGSHRYPVEVPTSLGRYASPKRSAPDTGSRARYVARLVRACCHKCHAIMRAICAGPCGRTTCEWRLSWHDRVKFFWLSLMTWHGACVFSQCPSRLRYRPVSRRGADGSNSEDGACG